MLFSIDINRLRRRIIYRPTRQKNPVGRIKHYWFFDFYLRNSPILQLLFDFRY